MCGLVPKDLVREGQGQLPGLLGWALPALMQSDGSITLCPAQATSARTSAALGHKEDIAQNTKALQKLLHCPFRSTPRLG